MFKVYGAVGCGSCVQAKSLLDSNGIDYVYLNKGVDYDLSVFLEFNPRHRALPMITEVIDGQELYVGCLDDLKQRLKN